MMTGGQWASTALVIGSMVLVGGSLAARRLPARRFIGLAALWVGIFAAGALLASRFG